MWRFLPLLIIACAVGLLMFLPAILAFVFDPIISRRIRSYCGALGLSDIKVEAFPNHYGVHFRKDGQQHYAKCVVKRFKLHWKGRSPEDF